eukprot:TRINITY_DN342_c0_g3_i1.p2 TRINITY_DN342_c0_g3~~TRINITY_DN342_c0_g3_i1.p2  ORF type:complete len:140 (-),score=53.32 TRINITY_DN342_c0_g3_i1:304-723(-)
MALPTAMKAMKAMKSTTAKAKGKQSMKSMKSMKAKRVSKIASGRLAKSLVLRGKKVKTIGGLTQESLMKNKRGKVVSKKQAANGKRAFKNVETWVDSVMQARKALSVNGFVPINGGTLQGKALYVKSKALYAAGKAASA